ncbi:hypothetical protein ACRALDRAFT_1040207 [Sodiomyces alcalophilus JCM 7366]|uniref:uncharacterized protein n=1 Tax=Sodiomyces alcalophilus JCM 7366 TaxID=591952 RepID=UPI0039B3AF3E
MSATDGEDRHVPDRGPAVFAVTVATLALATVFVSARLFCRSVIVKNVRWDDRIMVLGWILAFGLSFTIAYGTQRGLGRYDEDIDANHHGALRRCEYVFSILYNPALMAIKSSILVFYLRLSKNTQMLLRIASWVTLVIINIAGTVLTFMNIFQCNPVSAAWQVWTEPVRCIPLLTEFICAAPVNIITNLVIVGLPIPVITSMRLPPRQKYILVFTFSLGIFVTVVDVIRIYYLQRAISTAASPSTDRSTAFGGTPDFAWKSSLSFMWSAVEVNIAMICACIPTLKPLIVKILPAILIDPDRTRRSSSGRKEEDSDAPSRFRSGSEGMGLPAAAESARAGGIHEPDPAHAREREGGRASTDADAGDMSALEFITMPSMLNQSSSSGNPTAGLRNVQNVPVMGAVGSREQDNSVYFGFVNLKRPKSMIKCNAHDSFRYCLVVTVLFLLWGISYGLLNILNNAVAAVAGMTDAERLGLTTAYFGFGYFCGPLLVGEWILRRDEHHRVHRTRDGDDTNRSIGGFKATFIVGLCLYGVGTIIFWPSAVMESWGGFLLSNFVVGVGLSTLETGANAFMILCGPAPYGEARLCLAQAIQAVGSLLSVLMAQRVFFDELENRAAADSVSLLKVQWTYLAITLLCAGLALLLYYIPLPEVGDAELQEAADRLPIDPEKRTAFGGLQLRTVCLILAVTAQYTYTACQESNSIFFRTSDPMAMEDEDRLSGLALSIADYRLVGHAAFAASRFLAAFLTYMTVKNARFPQPRTLLTISVAGSFLFALLIVVLRPHDPNMLVIPVILFYFAEGPCWPLIFAIGLRGQGRRTKRAAAFITMGGSGAAFFPFVMWAIIRNGGTVQLSFVVIVALCVITLVYPLFLTVARDARAMTDPRNAVVLSGGSRVASLSGHRRGRVRPLT